jgi:hypothetical protein
MSSCEVGLHVVSYYDGYLRGSAIQSDGVVFGGGVDTEVLGLLSQDLIPAVCSESFWEVVREDCQMIGMIFNVREGGGLGLWWRVWLAADGC